VLHRQRPSGAEVMAGLWAGDIVYRMPLLMTPSVGINLSTPQLFVTIDGMDLEM
jgi:hypothetical protein